MPIPLQALYQRLECFSKVSVNAGHFFSTLDSWFAFLVDGRMPSWQWFLLFVLSFGDVSTTICAEHISKAIVSNSKALLPFNVMSQKLPVPSSYRIFLVIPSFSPEAWPLRKLGNAALKPTGSFRYCENWTRAS